MIMDAAGESEGVWVSVLDWLTKTLCLKSWEELPSWERNEETLDALTWLMTVNERYDNAQKETIDHLSNSARAIEHDIKCRENICKMIIPDIISDPESEWVKKINIISQVAFLSNRYNEIDEPSLLNGKNMTEIKKSLIGSLLSSKQQEKDTKAIVYYLKYLIERNSHINDSSPIPKQNNNHSIPSDVFLNLYQKDTEYIKRLNTLQSTWAQNPVSRKDGMDSRLPWERYQELSDKLKTKEKDLAVIKAKLDRFHKLPCDYSLARAQVFKVKNDLDHLREYKSKRLHALVHGKI
jgi:hypothetical protein